MLRMSGGGSFYGIGGMAGYISDASTLVRNSVEFGEIEADNVKNVGGMIGRLHNVSTRITDLKYCYFKNTSITKGVGSGISEELAIGKSETEIKSKAFVDELNKNIENGCPYEQENDDGTTTTVTIDTTGWAKWVYNENSYPTLDTTTTWDATTKTWVKE